MSELYRQTFSQLGITVEVRYVGIHPLGLHQWETQILGVEPHPRPYFKPVSEKKPTNIEIARYISDWYRTPDK